MKGTFEGLAARSYQTELLLRDLGILKGIKLLKDHSEVELAEMLFSPKERKLQTN